MDGLISLLASSGANIGIMAYSIFVNLIWVATDLERRNLSKALFKLQKDFNEALDPIGKIVAQCHTMLEILTRGRR
jgi:hypothetical protein